MRKTISPFGENPFLFATGAHAVCANGASDRTPKAIKKITASCGISAQDNVRCKCIVRHNCTGFVDNVRAVIDY